VLKASRDGAAVESGNAPSGIGDGSTAVVREEDGDAAGHGFDGDPAEGIGHGGKNKKVVI
jgi:hypothetical protein